MRQWWFVGYALWWGCQSAPIEPSPDPGPTVEAPVPLPTVAPDPVPEPVAPWVPPPDPLARCCHAMTQGCGPIQHKNTGLHLAALCVRGRQLEGAAARQRHLLSMHAILRNNAYYRPLLKGACSLTP